MVQKPVALPVTNCAARSNVAPALDVTCPVEKCLPVASGCTASSEHSLHVGVLQLCVKSARMTVVLVPVHRAPRA